MSWVITQAFFRGEDGYSDDMFNELSDEQKQDLVSPVPFRFLSEEVVRYNKSSNGYTTIGFRNGYSIVIEMKIEYVDRIFIK
jgi:hypothetical protein